MEKMDLAWVAGIYESGAVGTSSKEGESYNQASSKSEKLDLLIEVTGLGSLAEFDTRNGKHMYGWDLTIEDELGLLKLIRPYIRIPSKQKQADKWMDMQANLRGKEPAKPAVRRKSRAK